MDISKLRTHIGELRGSVGTRSTRSVFIHCFDQKLFVVQSISGLHRFMNPCGWNASYFIIHGTFMLLGSNTVTENMNTTVNLTKIWTVNLQMKNMSKIDWWNFTFWELKRWFCSFQSLHKIFRHFWWSGPWLCFFRACALFPLWWRIFRKISATCSRRIEGFWRKYFFSGILAKPLLPIQLSWSENLKRLLSTNKIHALVWT